MPSTNLSPVSVTSPPKQGKKKISRACGPRNPRLNDFDPALSAPLDRGCVKVYTPLCRKDSSDVVSELSRSARSLQAVLLLLSSADRCRRGKARV